MSNEGTEHESHVNTNYGNRIHSRFARTGVAHSESEVKNRIKLWYREISFLWCI